MIVGDIDGSPFQMDLKARNIVVQFFYCRWIISLLVFEGLLETLLEIVHFFLEA